MAIVSAYPVPANGGPLINLLCDQPTEFKFDLYEFEDGGVSVNVRPCGLKRWFLGYEGLTPLERALLISHRNLAKGQANTFSFMHPREGILYTGVSYEQFEITRHRKSWVLGINVTLRAFV